jgi:murein DD-endopeptidase MepM/ murein hydrolase activator NlpD
MARIANPNPCHVKRDWLTFCAISSFRKTGKNAQIPAIKRLPILVDSATTDALMCWRFVRRVAVSLFLLGTVSGQDIEIVREKQPIAPKAEIVTPKQADPHLEKITAIGRATPPLTVAMPKTERNVFVQTSKPAAIAQKKSEPVKANIRQSSSIVAKEPSPKVETSARIAGQAREDRHVEFPAGSPEATAPNTDEAVQQTKYSGAMAFVKLADGFDYPVGKPNGKGYYKARGFRSHGHLGEDWDGLGGGDTDLGDPIYCIGDGVVVLARDCKLGWGNVVIVRHVYRDGDAVKSIDSLYGHLQKILVHKGQAVKRGQQLATMGNAHGLYDAHLHLEVRRNIEIGMSRAAFARDFNNYYDPSQFITSHRVCPKSYGSFRVAMDTFKHDEKIRWDRVRRFSGHRGGGSSESAIALKKALAGQGAGTQ